MWALTKRKDQNILGNFFGAFADCAILFPLLVLFSAKGLYSPVALLVSSGLLYVFAGAFFRIPMPVQPLKSIAVGALAMGATPLEIRWCAILLGLFLLFLIGSRKESLLELVPARLVHQVQVGLGALLLGQAHRCLAGDSLFVFGLCAGLGFLIFLLSDWKGIPWMGVFAVVGMIYAFSRSLSPSALSAPVVTNVGSLRWGLIFSLLLPQVALTLANSVVGARAAVQTYFPRKGERVSYRALCISIGAGNILMALLGGLPFCHGSGGLTAHVRGGATSALANYVIGGFLLLLGMVSWKVGSVALVVPPVFVGTLLLVTGVQHMTLARATAATSFGQISLGIAFFLAILTQNLLWVLAAGLGLEGLDKIFGPLRWSTEEK